MKINKTPSPDNTYDIIIFDLGGVIIDVDMNNAIKAFAALHIDGLTYEDVVSGNDSLFRELELGLVTPAEWINKLREHFPASKDVADEDIWSAWNSVLLPYKKERIELVETIGENYTIYLFSNTNHPHRETFKAMFRNQFGYDLEELFEKCFYSDELHLRKPDPKAYQRITEELAIDPRRILFIDDNRDNIEQAQANGWHGYHLKTGEAITDIFY